jgi:hypothetical protein
MGETPQGVFMSNYTIELTDNELSTLGWAVDHGYFPAETYDAMHLTDGEPNDFEKHLFDNISRSWSIPEHAAWAITLSREDDPHALFTCIGGSLLEKLIHLENQIV